MAQLSRIVGTSSGAALMALILSSGLWAQVEGPGPKPTIPGRRVLTGTLTSAVPSKTFSAPLAPGLYRITYLSAAAPAVLQVSVDGVVVGSAAHSQPFATVMRIVNGQLKGTVDLAPTGLCSSDVVGDGDCAGQKLHFRLTRQSVVTIKVNGRPAKVAPFQLLLDPLQVAPLPEELSANSVFNAYLAFGDGPQVTPPVATYRLHVQSGQRLGILVGSPDFTSTVEARNSSGALVTTNSGFNDLLDPCREVKIDRLPKFDPYSQTNSYIVIDAPENATYVINVRAHYAGETGLFILRTFDLTDPKIEPKQMRSGLLRKGVNEFVVSIPSGWQSGGGRIVGYSLVPITIILKDISGRQFATSVNQMRDPVQPGVQTSQLTLMYATAVDLDAIEPDALANARVEVTSDYDTPGQPFLIGLAAEWGSCGGGAVDPVAIIYPAVSEFSDRGYPMAVPQKPLAVFEAILYDVARSDLKWNVLLQAPGGDHKDPTDLVSNYVRLVPEQASLSNLLVDYQVAVRAQFSPTTGATRLWTRVERRGFKEKDWRVDLAETAKTQQRFVERLRDHLSLPK